MTDEIKHKMFTDPITLVTQSQLLMLMETLERSQSAMYSLILSLTDKGLITAEILEIMTTIQKEQYWAMRWADDKVKSLGSEIDDWNGM